MQHDQSNPFIHQGIFKPALLASMISSMLISPLAYAAENGNNKTELSELDKVVITGTRRADQTSLTASAPIDVLSNEELTATGASDLFRALVSLSPSFSYPAAPGGAFASSIPAGAALRGLSSDEVLILVNGKRRHIGANLTRQGLSAGRGAGSADLSLIPVSGVDRVEILRDGAAAQYGSDAIAGVINIVLKGTKEGGGISYRYGEYKKGDGEQNKLSGWKGFELPNGGFLTLSFDAGNQDFANDTNPDTRVFYAPGDPREQTTPYRTWRFGSPKVKDQYNIAVNAEVPLTAELSAYGLATLAHRVTVGENFYEPPSTTALLNQSVYFKQRYPDGRVPVNVYTLDDAAVTGGLIYGNNQSGKFDLGINYGENTVKSKDQNGINPSYGPNSPSEYETGKRKSAQSNVTLDYVRDIPVSFLITPLTVSAGLAYRWEQYQLTAGDPLAYTRGPFFNPSTVNGVGVPAIYSGITDQDQRKISRNVHGGYVGLEGNFNEKLNLGLALRSEDYSDFGGTTTGKVSARYELTPEWAVRSTVSTGYRAPSILQLGYSAFSVQTTNLGGGQVVDVQQRTLLPDSAAAALLGGKPLQPEKSDNVSLGFVWRPVSNGSITLDTYQIKIKNRIVLSDNLTGAAVTTTFAGTAYAGINNAAFFTNLLDTRTHGYELSGKYLLSLGTYGKLDLRSGFSSARTKITKARDVVTATGTVIPSTAIVGVSTRSLIESVSPNNKLNLGATWTHSVWDVSVAGRRYGSWYVPDATTAINNQKFSPQWVADLDVSYRFSGALRGLKLTAGAINLFDSHPDHSNGTGTGGIVKYSFNSPEGYQGALYYTSAKYDF